jgi:hypothetical protein
VPTPDLGDARYLWEWLHDAGLSKPGAMGPIPIDWLDLQAWQHGTGHRAQPWELRAMLMASRSFVFQLRDAEDPHCPAPWAALSSALTQEHVANKVAAILGTGRNASPKQP